MSVVSYTRYRHSESVANELCTMCNNCIWCSGRLFATNSMFVKSSFVVTKIFIFSTFNLFCLWVGGGDWSPNESVSGGGQINKVTSVFHCLNSANIIFSIYSWSDWISTHKFCSNKIPYIELFLSILYLNQEIQLNCPDFANFSLADGWWNCLRVWRFVSLLYRSLKSDKKFNIFQQSFPMGEWGIA